MLALNIIVKKDDKLEIDIQEVEGIHCNEVVHSQPRGLRVKLKLRFCVGHLDLPGERFTSSRGVEHVATHMWLSGTSTETWTNNVGGCEIYKEKRDKLEKETRNMTKVCEDISVCGLESNERAIAILGDIRCPLTAKQDRDRINQQFWWTNSTQKKGNERQNVGGVAIKSKDGVLRLESGAWSTVKPLKQATNVYATPRVGFSPVLWGWRRMATTV